MICDPRIWQDTLSRLRGEIPDFAFAAWIRPLAVKLAEDRVILGCPTTFHRDRVRFQFHDPLTRCLRAAGTKAPIELVCMSEFASRPGHRFEAFEPESESAVGAAVEVGGEAAACAAGRTPRAARSVRALPIARAASHAGRPSPARASASVPGTVANGSTARMPGGSAGPQPQTEGEARLSAGPEGSIRTAAPQGGTANGTSSKDTASAEPSRAIPAGRSAGRRAPSSSSRSGRDADPGAPGLSRNPGTQIELPFSFESFVVGPCNALAREAALALARTRQRSLNQVYLGGESGMGKTHLARATAVEARRAAADPSGPPFPARMPGAGAGVVYTSAERFTSDFVSAMRNGRGDDFQRRYRAPIGLLIVEDIQFFSGRAKTQLELFHTVQHVLDAGGRVLLTGDRSPRELEGLDARVRAQVGQGFVAELEPPDAIVRRHILRSKAAAGGVGLPEDCLDVLVEASRGSVRDIESMLIQVVTTSSLLGRPIDLDLTRDAIALKTSASSVLPTRRVEVSEIVRTVAAFFGKRPETLASKSRRRDVLVPRQLAMYLAHRYTKASYAEIGRSLGRGHPSVRNAIERIERQVLENAPIRYQVEALSERIDATLGKPS